MQPQQLEFRYQSPRVTVKERKLITIFLLSPLPSYVCVDLVDLLSLWIMLISHVMIWSLISNTVWSSFYVLCSTNSIAQSRVSPLSRATRPMLLRLKALRHYLPLWTCLRIPRPLVSLQTRSRIYESHSQGIVPVP